MGSSCFASPELIISLPTSGDECTDSPVVSIKSSSWTLRHSPRVPGSHDRVQPTKPAPASSEFCGLLSWDPDAPGIAEGHAGASPNPISESRADHFDPGSRRSPSSLRASSRLNAATFTDSGTVHVLPHPLAIHWTAVVCRSVLRFKDTHGRRTFSPRSFGP